MTPILLGGRSLDAEFGLGIDDTTFGAGIPLFGGATDATGLLEGEGDPCELLGAGVMTLADGFRNPER